MQGDFIKMFGEFIVLSIGEPNDGAGFGTVADVKSGMDANIMGRLYLPPYMRKSVCGIDAGSHVIGYMDVATGIGCALCGLDGADYGYYMDADMELKKDIKIDGKAEIDGKITANDEIAAQKDISTSTGDVKAGTISLKTHTHPITAASFTGTIDPVTGSAAGTISGGTEVPT